MQTNFAVTKFVSEEELETFEGWLKYQGIDPASPPDVLATWRDIFDDVRAQSAATPKVGRMQLKPIAGEYRYAVAIRDGHGLWLTLWVRRSPKGEYFVMQPRGDGKWNPHASYHRDGWVHMKSYDRKMACTKRQPLSPSFRGVENLGYLAGHGGKSIGAECDPTCFTGVIEVGPDVLGPRHGAVAVHLVEPGREVLEDPWFRVIERRVFKDVVPWVVITAGEIFTASETQS